MPRQNRPSLSAPTYGSLTGNINWSRGMGERLAKTPTTNFAAPTVQPAETSRASTKSNTSPGLITKIDQLKYRENNGLFSS